MMSEERNTQTVSDVTPAPALEPAVHTPSTHASFDSERRTKLADWARQVDGPEMGAEEIVAAIVEAEKGEVSGEPVVVTDDTPAEETGLTAEAPTPEEEAADVVEEPAEPARPKHYAVRHGEEEVGIPEGVTFTYKADGAERTRTLDEVIQYAQLGENFDRRSRDLAQTQRQMEDSYRQAIEHGQKELQDSWNQFMELTQKLHEDDEFREEYFEEYERLKNNPDELELRRKAKLAEQYEQQINADRQRQYEEWNRNVWTTVDTILGEQLADYEDNIRGNLSDRVRSRFHQAVSQYGNTVITEAYLTNLIREERSIIDTAVQRARQQVEQDVLPRVERARVEAVTQTKNRLTELSLQRNKEAIATPAMTATPVRQAKPISTMGEAAKALNRWAES
jgi:hypothetical protein